MADAYNDGTKNLDNASGWHGTYTPPSTFGGAVGFPGNGNTGIVPSTIVAVNTGTYEMPYVLNVLGTLNNSGNLKSDLGGNITIYNGTNSGTISSIGYQISIGSFGGIGNFTNTGSILDTNGTVAILCSAFLNTGIVSSANLSFAPNTIIENQGYISAWNILSIYPDSKIHNNANGTFHFGNTLSNVGTIGIALTGSSGATSFGGAIIGSVF
jgi:hypothetical protein